jgi:hypothetical protein
MRLELWCVQDVCQSVEVGHPLVAQQFHKVIGLVGAKPHKTLAQHVALISGVQPPFGTL